MLSKLAKKKVNKQAKQKKLERDRKTLIGLEEIRKTSSAETEEIIDDETMDYDFSFVKKGEVVPPSDLEKDIKYLLDRKRMRGTKWEIFVRGLERGIGVHHAGVPKKYLELVEQLFRVKHLKVVIATATLSLGIHMPCKSVVFAGDWSELKSLEYRQMSGRAGRRGFDPLGHVIFFGLGKSKLERLNVSSLPVLRGHFPLTNTLVLRTMMLYHFAQDKAVALKTITNLFKQPFFAVGKAQQSDQMGYHFRFSVEYSMREGLLSSRGEPTGLAGLVSYLHDAEPSNFLIASLFREKVFHEIVAGTEKDELKAKQAQTQLLHLLAFLFRRVPLPRGNSEWMTKNKGIVLKSTALPNQEKFSRVWDDYNERALRIFRYYIVSFARLNADKLPVESKLPASSLQFPSASKSPAPSDSKSLVDTLVSSAVPYVARSPFSALSGSGDEFKTVTELASSLREGIHLDPSSVPIVPRVDDHNREVLLNSYIIDFVTSGSLNPLYKVNGIRRGDVYTLLKDFQLLLRSLSYAVATIAPSSDLVGKALKAVSEDFDTTFHKAFANQS